MVTNIRQQFVLERLRAAKKSLTEIVEDQSRRSRELTLFSPGYELLGKLNIIGAELSICRAILKIDSGDVDTKQLVAELEDVMNEAMKKLGNEMDGERV